MSVRAVSNVFPGPKPYTQTLELSRFVCLPAAPANSETFFLARAFRLAAAAAGLRGVVSFADPMPRSRTLPDGAREQLTPGHVGLIYQALGGVALGRSTPRQLVYVPQAAVVLPARTLQKVRAAESGCDGAEAQLVRLGAQPRGRGQSRTVWLGQALDQVGATRVRHPGNFRYAWPLGSATQRRYATIAGERTLYPKPDTHRLPLPA